MDCGKTLRLGRFTRRGGAVIVPMDHGLFSEPPAALADLRALVKTVAASEADGILITPGMLPHVADVAEHLAVILRIDGTHTRMGQHIERCDLMCTPDSALALGADMVVVNGYVGTENEHEQLGKLGRVAVRCRELGLPLMGEMIPGSRLGFHFGRSKKDATLPGQVNRDLWTATRTGVEIGADVIKTHYSGDAAGFAQIARSVPSPIWIAGGPLDKKGDGPFLEMIAQAVAAGAKGVVIGRNVWQRESPKEMIKALCKIVHHT